VIRFALAVALVFLVVGLLRVARIWLAGGRAPRPSKPRALESEMVRDPVCGTWIDRRLALAGRRGGEAIAVCSEKCLRALESA
jgi:YHS domain-containing protein